MTKAGLNQEVVDRAFAMEPEQLSEPFLSPDGYNIIYVVTRRERVEREFDRMRGAVIRRLREERLDQTYETYINDLRGTAEISIVSTRVEELEVQGRPRSSRVPVGSSAVPSLPEDVSNDQAEEIIENLRRGER